MPREDAPGAALQALTHQVQDETKAQTSQRRELAGYKALISSNVVRAITASTARIAHGSPYTDGSPSQKTRKGYKSNVSAGYGVDAQSLVSTVLQRLAVYMGGDTIDPGYREALATIPGVAVDFTQRIAKREASRSRGQGLGAALPGADVERTEGTPNYAMALDMFGDKAASAGVAHPVGVHAPGVPERHAPSLQGESLHNRLTSAGVIPEHAALVVAACRQTSARSRVTAEATDTTPGDAALVRKAGRVRYWTDWAIVAGAPDRNSVRRAQRAVYAALDALHAYEDYLQRPSLYAAPGEPTKYKTSRTTARTFDSLEQTTSMPLVLDAGPGVMHLCTIPE